MSNPPHAEEMAAFMRNEGIEKDYDVIAENCAGIAITFTYSYIQRALSLEGCRR